jgi:hypothetical protein
MDFGKHFAPEFAIFVDFSVPETSVAGVTFRLSINFFV